VAENNKDEKKEKNDQPKEGKHPDDFKFIVRLSNTDVQGDKTLVNGLTSIKGIGRHLSSIIIETTGLDQNLRVGNLTDDQITLLQETIDTISEIAPSWMLNHQKDFETGEDIHLIGPEIEMKLRDEINMMRKIRCYRGIRHEQGLSVRGQRTRSNKRSGLTLGVSRSR